jgi:hypothetical protein
MLVNSYIFDLMIKENMDYVGCCKNDEDVVGQRTSF